MSTTAYDDQYAPEPPQTPQAGDQTQNANSRYGDKSTAYVSEGAVPDAFDAWWTSASHRRKYSSDHPAYLAAREAWREARQPSAADQQALNTALDEVFAPLGGGDKP